MPGLRHNILKAVRAALVADSTLIALVPAAKIRTGYSPTLTEFPCVTIRHDGGRNGYSNSRAGTLFVTSYSADDQPESALAAIIDAIDDVLDENAIDISNSDTHFAWVLNEYESPTIPEQEIAEDVFSVALQYGYMAIAK